MLSTGESFISHAPRWWQKSGQSCVKEIPLSNSAHFSSLWGLVPSRSTIFPVWAHRGSFPLRSVVSQRWLTEPICWLLIILFAELLALRTQARWGAIMASLLSCLFSGKHALSVASLLWIASLPGQQIL